MIAAVPLRWILKILHAPQYVILWESWECSIRRSCRIFSINRSSSSIRSNLLLVMAVAAAVAAEAEAMSITLGWPLPLGATIQLQKAQHKSCAYL